MATTDEYIYTLLYQVAVFFFEGLCLKSEIQKKKENLEKMLIQFSILLINCILFKTFSIVHEPNRSCLLLNRQRKSLAFKTKSFKLIYSKSCRDPLRTKINYNNR